MADDNRAKEMPEKETQESPMPSEQQKTPESEVPEQADLGTEGADQTKQEDGLPEGAKARTRQEFEKLQEKLREERSRREYLETVFNSLQTKKEPVKDEETQPLYDPNTGLVNENVLTDVQKRALDAEKRARKAEEAISRYEQAQLEREDEAQRTEAFKTYPQLDPNANEFDKEFSMEVERILYHSMVKPEAYGLDPYSKGQGIKYKDAADIVNKRLTAMNKAKEQGATEAIENLTPKEQAALEATGSPARRSQTTNIDDLRRRTRKGDIDAIVERLNRLKS